MTKNMEHGRPNYVAFFIGSAVGFAAALAIYRIVFKDMHRDTVEAGYGLHMWGLLIFIGLTIGSTVSSVIRWDAKRRERRDAIPRAQVRKKP